ncbi:hypothetical protein ACLK19_06025 [Escherichia coli]
MNWRVSADMILMPKGFKVIEFAQSGLKPLVKFARQMGIDGMYWSMAMKQGRNTPLTGTQPVE